MNFQLSTEQNTKKDVQVMKVVHDLKNPVIAIKQSIMDSSATIESTKECIHDIEEIEEMLENLRAEFK